MTLKPARFKPEEEISVSGKAMRIAGLVQYEGPDGALLTRYLLADPAGAPQVLEESGDKLFLLRAFPPTAQPQASGNTISVMGEKYALAGVRKLKLLGTAGQPPGGPPRGELLLSGQFNGAMGAMLREMSPGVPAQAFYSLKPVHATEVLSGEQLAKVKEAERLAAELQAQADDEAEDGKKGSPLQKVVSWAVVILVIGGLVYACSSDEESSSSGSARTSFSWGSDGGGHGGK